MEMLSQKACILPKIVVFEYIDIDLEFQNERKIERRSKRFERERDRKVLKILSSSGSASAADFSERTKALSLSHLMIIYWYKGLRVRLSSIYLSSLSLVEKKSFNS